MSPNFSLPYHAFGFCDSSISAIMADAHTPVAHTPVSPLSLLLLPPDLEAALRDELLPPPVDFICAEKVPIANMLMAFEDLVDADWPADVEHSVSDADIENVDSTAGGDKSTKEKGTDNMEEASSDEELPTIDELANIVAARKRLTHPSTTSSLYFAHRPSASARHPAGPTKRQPRNEPPAAGFDILLYSKPSAAKASPSRAHRRALARGRQAHATELNKLKCSSARKLWQGSEHSTGTQGHSHGPRKETAGRPT